MCVCVMIYTNLTTTTATTTPTTTTGYNYTAEYNHVYRGKSSWTTAYEDIFTLIIRALKTQDSTLSNEDAGYFAEYVLRMIGKCECYQWII